MAISNTKRERFTKNLKEQKRFIERSCITFDQGEEDEAKRIASALRIIFHDTGKSVSLKTHLGLRGKKVFSSSRGYGNWQSYLAQEIDLSSLQPVRMSPLLGQEFRVISIGNWWEGESVFVHDGRSYTRKKIVLSIANRDGGAHVDNELEPYYEVLCAGEYAGTITGNLNYNGEPPFPQGVAMYALNAHLALMRQFAHEFLMSINYFKWIDES